MKLCDEGIQLLAEGVLQIASRDYKYCWAIKKLYHGGDWQFVGQIKNATMYKTKYAGKKCVVAKGGSAGMRGTVDENIEKLESFFRNHQIVGDDAERIISFLREEALNDELNRKLAETAKNKTTKPKVTHKCTRNRKKKAVQED